MTTSAPLPTNVARTLLDCINNVVRNYCYQSDSRFFSTSSQTLRPSTNLWKIMGIGCSINFVTIMDKLYTISSHHLIPQQNTTISALLHHTTDFYLHVQATLPMPIFTARCTMHSAKRGLAIACRLSVCPSVRLSVRL